MLIHANSHESFKNLSRDKRRQRILSIYQASAGVECFTDRQICRMLGFEDLNAVRPRISEMVKEGLLFEAGKIKDELTKTSVRLVRLRIAGDPEPKYYGPRY